MALWPRADVHEEVTMHAGLHALSWSLHRLGIGLAILAGLVFFAYFVIIAVIVVGQAMAGFGT